MKFKNVALTISLVSLAIGFSDFQENMLFWPGRPIGAIFAIVYFLFVILEKSFAEFDAEHQTAAPDTSVKTSLAEKGIPALTRVIS